MGIVYRAVDRLTGEPAALKQVLADTEQLAFQSRVAGTGAVQVALAYEFQLLPSLRHPNSISVLDYGFDARRLPYYTMELIDGGLPIADDCMAN